MVTANSKIFRAMVVDKREWESEEKLGVTVPVSLPATSWNLLVGAVVSDSCQR